MSATGSLESLLQRAIQQHQLPGLAVVIHRNGVEEFAAGYGHCDAACQYGITPDSMFGVASVTKVVTAMMVMRLAEQHLLSIADPVASHFSQLQAAQASPMHLAHLLSHSAGFAGLPCRFSAHDLTENADSSGGVSTVNRQVGCADNPPEWPMVCADDLVDFINQLKINQLATPGQLLNYSNEGFCLLGGIIERLTDSTYPDAVHKHLFKPLGMTRSTVGGRYLASFDNVAKPLRRHDDGFVDTQVWDAPLFYPAGGVVASATDLVKLLKVFDSDTALLSSKSIEQMTTPRIGVSSRSQYGVNYGYGLGLEVETVDADTRLVWHTGQRMGVSSFVGRLLKQNIDIALLCNVADAPTASIGHQLISVILDRGDIAWPPSQLADKRSVSVQSHCISSSAQSRLSGCYESDEGFSFNVEEQGGELMLCSSSSQERMIFFDDESGIAGEQTFRFLTRTNGPAWALALDLRVFERGGKA